MYGAEVAALRGAMHLPTAQVRVAESRVPGVLRVVAFRARLAERRRVWKVPGGTVKLLVNLGDGVELAGDGPAWRAPAGARGLVIGPQARPVRGELAGLQHSVQVQLTPLGAYALFGMPLAELANAVTDLRDVLGERGRRLVERVAEADEPARAAVLLAAVERGVAAGPAVDPAVERAWRRLRAAHGRPRVSALAAEVGLSRRHLTRSFHRQLGLPPKRLARIVRVQAVLGMVAAGATLAEAAEAIGYYDQPHLDNDFRELTGRTPTGLIMHGN